MEEQKILRMEEQEALNRELEQARDSFRIDFSDAETRVRPILGRTYSINDRGDQSRLGLLVVGVPGGTYKSGQATQELKDMFTTPRDQLKALVAADIALKMDIREMKDEFKIRFEKANHFPYARRIIDGEKQILISNTEYQEPNGGTYHSHRPLGELAVGLTQFVPGKHDYSRCIYRRGDLKYTFLMDRTLFERYVERAALNARSLDTDWNLSGFPQTNWAKIAKTLIEVQQDPRFGGRVG